MPLFADQFANARALDAAGAAAVVEPADLRAAILAPPHREPDSRASCTPHRPHSRPYERLRASSARVSISAAGSSRS